MNTQYPSIIEAAGVIGNWSDIVDPDCETPGQFADRHKSTELSPEQRLLFAIIEDAVNILVNLAPIYDSPSPPTQKELYRMNKRQRQYWYDLDWLKSDVNRYGSFVYCCEHLGIDHEHLRASLLSDRSRKFRIHRPAIRDRAEIKP